MSTDASLQTVHTAVGAAQPHLLDDIADEQPQFVAVEPGGITVLPSRCTWLRAEHSDAGVAAVQLAAADPADQDTNIRFD